MANRSVLKPFHDVPYSEPAFAVTNQAPLDIRSMAFGEVQSPVQAAMSRFERRFVVGATKGRGVDFTSVEQAAAKINELGGGGIFIRRGTYYPQSAVVVYSNTYLIGEDPTSTILDFSNASGIGSGAIQCIGASPVGYGVGSVATTSNSAIVTGASTDFVTAGVASGDMIIIGNIPLTVLSVQSATQLTLTQNYKGASLSGVGYQVLRPRQNVGISNLTVKNSQYKGDYGINALYVENIKITNCIVEGNVIGIHSNQCFNIAITANVARYNFDCGIEVGGTYGGQLENNYCFGNGGSGIVLSSFGTSQPMVTTRNQCVANGVYGLHLFVGTLQNITNNTFYGNANHGIWFEGSSKNNITSNYIMKNGGNGIRLDPRISVHSSQNMIQMNHVRENNLANAIYLATNQDNNMVMNNYNDTTISNNGLGNMLFDNWI